MTTNTQDIKVQDKHTGYDFMVGQTVKKVTGEYNINGTIVSIFRKLDGAVRMVVEHKAEGGGSFLHIYGPNNLQIISHGLNFDEMGG